MNEIEELKKENAELKRQLEERRKDMLPATAKKHKESLAFSTDAVFRAKRVSVIEVDSVEGTGTESDPVKHVASFWTDNGRLIGSWIIRSNDDQL